MKRIPCDLFNEGEHIYFNIMRLGELESALKIKIQDLVSNNIGILDLIHCYAIGLAHEKRRTPQWYSQKMQELVEKGYTFEQLAEPVIKAIIGSGIVGKAAYYSVFPDEMTEDDKAEIEAEQEKNG